MTTVPHKPLHPPERIEQFTFGSQIAMSFEELTADATGGSPILSYNLQIDSVGGGSGPWIEVQGESEDILATSGVVTGLTPGEPYFFRYRARNAHGWSEPSNVHFTLMATRPDQIPPSPSRTVDSDRDVIISWDATPNERDSAVTAYRVNVKSRNGISYQVSTCLGSEPQVVIDRSCTIPMTVLIEAPFLLEEGDTVVAIVEALNEIGYSEPSEENTSGAVIQVVPHAPATIPRRGD